MRHTHKHNFLKQHIKHIESVTDLPADASFRYYSRVEHKDNAINSPLIVMDCDPMKDQSMPSFIEICNFLQKNNLRVPDLHKIDHQNGFILMEDIGDASLTKHLETTPEDEEKYYIGSIDILHKLHSIKPLGNFDIYNMEKYLRESMEFIEWYVEKLKNISLSQSTKNKFEHILVDLIDKLKLPHNVTVLRDFHADNLMIHENNIVILDFQDALIGSPAYDIVSLLEDARRDVQSSTVSSSLSHFTKDMNKEQQDAFLYDYTVLGLQRNLKIMGFIARKMIRDNNDNYLKLSPRVKNYIKNNLQQEYTEPMQRWIYDNNQNFFVE